MSTLNNPCICAQGAPRLEPEPVLALCDATMRGCGLSGQKMAYIRDLAQRFQCGQFCTERIVGAGPICTWVSDGCVHACSLRSLTRLSG